MELETRISKLEAICASLADHNQTHIKNIRELHKIAPATAETFTTMDKAIGELHVEIKGFRELVDQLTAMYEGLAGRMASLEAKLGAPRKGGAN